MIGTSVVATRSCTNFAVSMAVLTKFPEAPIQLAALLGIAAGTALNFLSSRYLVFRATHIRAGTADPGTKPDPS